MENKDIGKIDVNTVFTPIQEYLKDEKRINIFSKIIDAATKELVEREKISKNASKLIKEGKNTVVEKIKESIDQEFDKQIKYIRGLNKEVNNWKTGYQKKDIKNMRKASQEIEKTIEKIMPIDKLLKEAKEILNIQKLIEKNDNQFGLSDTKLELAKMLA